MKCNVLCLLFAIYCIAVAGPRFALRGGGIESVWV